ncbi:hypothetical protein Metme_3631 [Methylomonas methanica MC09]|uniref:YD repeat-containing protein n=1 Tax=Methylomonas methanica (strain DSM 25384 / MC09) TaxID=857087 RepID=F9ZVL0_METMM|nr:hypothetical protein Metme_3631 [Methylomonas methanica MC09]
MQYHYDAASRLERTDAFNGGTIGYGLDNANRLKGVKHIANGQTLADYQSVTSGLSQIISRLAPSLPITDHPNKA